MAQVPIAITLVPAHRTAAGVSAASKLLEESGIHVTVVGAATISARVDVAAFKGLFGVEPPPVGARPPSGRDFGAPAGFATEADLRIPQRLQGIVERINVQAPATRL
jgi:hypothetical protein